MILRFSLLAILSTCHYDLSSHCYPVAYVDSVTEAQIIQEQPLVVQYLVHSLAVLPTSPESVDCLSYYCIPPTVRMFTVCLCVWFNASFSRRCRVLQPIYHAP